MRWEQMPRAFWPAPRFLTARTFVSCRIGMETVVVGGRGYAGKLVTPPARQYLKQLRPNDFPVPASQRLRSPPSADVQRPQAQETSGRVRTEKAVRQGAGSVPPDPRGSLGE